jgi:L-ribulose-5-phosphate 4-epimerase
MSATATIASQVERGGLKLTGPDDAVRHDLIDAVRELHRAKVVPFGVFSNGSARLPGGDGILFSRGSLREDIGVDDFAIVDLSGNAVAGQLSAGTHPIVGMHTAVYRAYPEVNVVLHTHSTSATSFALARKPIPLHYEPLLYQGQLQDIPVTVYGERTLTGAVVGEVVAALETHPETKAVLLANHGLLAWAETAAAAARLVITIEEAATIILGAALLGGSQPIPIIAP